MKKLFLALALLISVAGKSQVTLEHSYPANEASILIYNLEGVGYRYMTTNRTNNTINLYDGNHNLWKSIDAKIPAGYSMRSAMYPSTKLFDLDTGVEVLVFYYKPNNYKAQIVDETGSILNIIPFAEQGVVQRFDTSWKLVLSMVDYTNTSAPVVNYSEVYSLPGQFLGMRTTKPNNNNNDPADLLYPNPTDDKATLEYTLPNGTEKGTVQLLNTNGTLLRTYSVNQNSGKLIIQRDGLPSGTYVITTISNGVASPAKQIVLY